MQAGSLPAPRLDDAAGPARRLAGVSRTGAVLAAITFILAACALGSEAPPEAVDAEAVATPEADAMTPMALEMAEQAIAGGRLSEAEQLLERVFLVDAANVRAQLALAELRLASGDPAQAVGAFVRLVEDPVVGPRARQGAGIAMLLIDAAETGVEHLRAAVEADSTLWRAWNALGSYYDSLGQWEAAAEAYGKALAERSDEAMLYNNRGFSFLMQGRLDEAVLDLQRALHLDPDMGPAQVNLRMALAWSGRYAHAMMGATDEDMPRILNNVGYVALLRGDFDNAEAYLQRAMEADPSFNKIAWRNLAYLRDMRDLKAAGAQAGAAETLAAETLAAGAIAIETGVAETIATE